MSLAVCIQAHARPALVAERDPMHSLDCSVSLHFLRRFFANTFDMETTGCDCCSSRFQQRDADISTALALPLASMDLEHSSLPLKGYVSLWKSMNASSGETRTNLLCCEATSPNRWGDMSLSSAFTRFPLTWIDNCRRLPLKCCKHLRKSPCSILISEMYHNASLGPKVAENYLSNDASLK